MLEIGNWDIGIGDKENKEDWNGRTRVHSPNDLVFGEPRTTNEFPGIWQTQPYTYNARQIITYDTNLYVRILST